MANPADLEKTFEAAIANAAGIVKANVQMVLDREEGLSLEGRAALNRVVGKLMPLADQEWLRNLRRTYDGD